MKRILLTGSSGFVGQSLNQYFKQYSEKYTIINTYRQSRGQAEYDENEHYIIGNLNDKTDWSESLNQIDIVIHLAARVHIMKENVDDPYSAFLQTNYLATLNLAEQAVRSGVKRFIYFSSIKVNGEETNRKPFFADEKPEPKGDYAVSKYKAEQALIRLSQETDLEVVIIRPPLIYGMNVKGNMKRLIKLIKYGIPLPFNKINNKRSIVGIENLCSFIQVCLTHPKAANEIFLIKDREDISTTKLFNLIAQANNQKARLFYIPEKIIEWLLSLFGKKAEYNRLFTSLHVNIDKNKDLLNWEPQIPTIDGFKSMLE